MKLNTLYKISSVLLINSLLITSSCTKLDTKVYDQILNDNFWKTPDQISAGIAPIYTQLRSGLGSGGSDFYEVNGVTSDEIIIPIRGGDWGDGGKHQRLFFHTWDADDPTLNDVWNYIFGGIGQCNFILDQVNSLPTKPNAIEQINAEIKTMRAYFYLMAIDLFGNVPIVSSFKIDPSTIKNNTRKEVFEFIEKDLLENIPLLSTSVNASTYGRANKWVGYSILAKLYLNAQVYTGTARWADCAKACDEIITNGGYSLKAGYFDNFKFDNDFNNNTENIFVAPFDNKYIGGQSKVLFALHYNSGTTFGLSAGGYNGWSSHGDYYYGNFDTLSTYTTSGDKVYRTFKDQRTGQFLVGQQFSVQYPYPQDKNILVKSSTDIIYDGVDLPLVLEPNFNTFEFPQVAGGTALTTGKFVGARNIKYFPQAGVDIGSQNNDLVLFRYADILLMKAESIMRDPAASSKATAVDIVNQIRLRAYSGDASNNWTVADLTPANLLKERAVEMSYEGFRRQDLIRFDVADGTNYFGGQRGGVRSPNKPADAGTHLRIFPIPRLQHTANNNLTQNPGYPAF